MTQHPTQSHCPDAELTNPCSILLMPSDMLGRILYNYPFLSHWFDSTGNRTPDIPHARPALCRFGHHTQSPVREVVSSNLDRVKPMISIIDTCLSSSRCMALTGYGKDWYTEYPDNVIKWDIRSWWQFPDFPWAML